MRRSCCLLPPSATRPLLPFSPPSPPPLPLVLLVLLRLLPSRGGCSFDCFVVRAALRTAPSAPAVNSEFATPAWLDRLPPFPQSKRAAGARHSRARYRSRRTLTRGPASRVWLAAVSASLHGRQIVRGLPSRAHLAVSHALSTILSPPSPFEIPPTIPYAPSSAPLPSHPAPPLCATHALNPMSTSLCLLWSFRGPYE